MPLKVTLHTRGLPPPTHTEPDEGSVPKQAPRRSSLLHPLQTLWQAESWVLTPTRAVLPSSDLANEPHQCQVVLFSSPVKYFHLFSLCLSLYRLLSHLIVQQTRFKWKNWTERTRLTPSLCAWSRTQPSSQMESTVPRSSDIVTAIGTPGSHKGTDLARML